MSTLRISDAPLLPDVDGTEKIPTGGRGDYAITVDQIKGHIFQDVGKELVGLGNVDNTSDLDKPVSTAQQATLDLKADKTYVDANLDLKADKTSVYTRSETSLALSKKADLVNGVVPESQIPSSFNDVLEFTTSTLPIVGESGKIYITTDTNRTWRWSGNQYVEISNGGISDSTLRLQTARKIANVGFDGTQDISIPHNNLSDRDVVGAHSATSILSSSGENQQDINDYNGAKWRNKTGGYELNARVMLDNGDIVKSTIDGNTNDPNTDMSGWQDVSSAQAITFETEISHGIRTAFDKFEEFKTLQDYGAIGDGTLKTLQHWIDTGRFSSLSAIQVAYPLASSLDESIDYVCLQDMINKNYGKRIYIKSKHYVINRGLRISQGISIIADQRSTFPYGYAATTAKLNFQSLADGEYALTIVGTDENKKITGVELDGFLLFGKQTVNGITIGESLSKDVTELIIRNTVCFNFKDALTTRYLYGATFDAFRAQSCVNGLLLGSQTNQVLFNRGGVVTISNIAISMSNCEGLQFNSYNISNLSKSNGAPITLYQSQAIFTNSYFEYVTNPILAQVGTRNEASYSSTLILDATFKFGESGLFHDIQVANHNAYVELTGRARFGARVVGLDDSTPHVSSIVSGDNLRLQGDSFIEDFPVGSWKTYVQYGGGVISQKLHRGFIRVTNSGASGSGLRLSEDMVTGELYTLSYLIRGTRADQVVSLKNGNKSAVALSFTGFDSNDLTIYHCSFIADDPNLRLLFTGDLDVYAYTLQKGNRRVTDITRFNTPSAAKRFVCEGVAPPELGGWKAGDCVFSFNNTGQLGWVCTNGTNNTWATMGVIGSTKATGLTESSTASQIVAALKAAGLAV